MRPTATRSIPLGGAPPGLAVVRPVPVLVRGPEGDRGRPCIARGKLASARPEAGQLIGSIDWPASIEARVGDSTPTAECVFDRSGRLLRVLVDLDGPDPTPDLDPDLDPDPTPDPNPKSHPKGPEPTRDGTAETSIPIPEDAEMAANEKPKTDPDADAPEMGAAARPAKPATVEELQARLDTEVAEKERIRASLEKTKAEDLRKRRRLDELEAAEEERKNANLGETEKAARSRQELERRAVEAERLADARDRQISEMRLERLVEAEARKVKHNNADGFENPELVFRLIDRTRVEFDPDSGEWTGVREAVEKFAKDYPNLLKQKGRSPGSPPRDDYPGNPNRRPARGGDEAPVNVIDDLRRKVSYPGR